MATEAEFLAARAAASGITTATAVAAVEGITGRAPRSVERFPGGWGAVPFWVTGADGEQLVVRVGIEERPYEAEAAVLRRAADGGIPVPAVVGVCRVEGRPVSVLERRPGRSLQELVAEGGWTPALRSCAVAAGELLARIHHLYPTGLPLSDGEPVGVIIERAQGIAGPTDPGLLAAAFDRLAVLATPADLALIHFDYGADHLLVDGGRISAVLDWEWSMLGEPAKDLAWWWLYEPEFGGGAAEVAAGYGPVDHVRVQAWIVARCLASLAFRARQGDDEGRVAMTTKLRSLL